MNTIIMIMTLLPLNLTHALKHRIPSNYPAQSPTQVGLEIDLPVKSPEPPAQGSVLVTVTAALFVTMDSLSSSPKRRHSLTQPFTYKPLEANSRSVNGPLIQSKTVDQTPPLYWEGVGRCLYGHVVTVSCQ